MADARSHVEGEGQRIRAPVAMFRAMLTPDREAGRLWIANWMAERADAQAARERADAVRAQREAEAKAKAEEDDMLRRQAEEQERALRARLESMRDWQIEELLQEALCRATDFERRAYGRRDRARERPDRRGGAIDACLWRGIRTHISDVLDDIDAGRARLVRDVQADDEAAS